MKIACPAPFDECSGGLSPADDIREKHVKVHSNWSETRKCQSRYLVKQGYKKLGQREFLRPEGGILLLSRKPGLVVKPGKRQAGTDSNRVNAAGIKSW